MYVGCHFCRCAGTGKTTFLRALASHTKRSIINIPLSRIRTNQQLMSLMMDQQVRVSAHSTTTLWPLCHLLRLIAMW
jgi:ABC-type nitrate/sulfonate/bicarbonate transport system ATPase subunit